MSAEDSRIRRHPVYELTDEQASALRILCRRSIRQGNDSDVRLIPVYGALVALTNAELPPCAHCGEQIGDEEVWIDPRTARASTGDDALPYHVGCAPNQYGEGEE